MVKLPFRTRKDGQVFLVKAKKGKSISQSLDRGKNVPLPTSELRKIAKERGIDIDKDITSELSEGRLVSLHPSNRELDNVIVKEKSPHEHDEIDLNESKELREEQNRKVAEEKNLRTDEDVQEEIDKQREKQAEKEEKKK